MPSSTVRGLIIFYIYIYIFFSPVIFCTPRRHAGDPLIFLKTFSCAPLRRRADALFIFDLFFYTPDGTREMRGALLGRQRGTGGLGAILGPLEAILGRLEANLKPSSPILRPISENEGFSAPAARIRRGLRPGPRPGFPSRPPFPLRSTSSPTKLSAASAKGAFGRFPSPG